MSVSYDQFTNAFLSKITEYDFILMDEEDRTEIVDGYMKTAITKFKYVCNYDLLSNADDDDRVFNIDIPEIDLYEIVEVVSAGMVCCWLKTFVNKQELLENMLNTRDFTTYSPAELLRRVGDAYKDANKEFTQSIREYSYNSGGFSNFHI